MATNFFCAKCGVKMSSDADVATLKCPICRIDMIPEPTPPTAPDAGNQTRTGSAGETAIVPPPASNPVAAPALQRPGKRLKVARPVRNLGDTGPVSVPSTEPAAADQQAAPVAGLAREMEQMVQAARKQAQKEADLILETARLKAEELARQITAAAKEQGAAEVETLKQQAQQGLLAEAGKLAADIRAEAEHEAENILARARNEAQETEAVLIEEARKLAAAAEKEAEAEAAKIIAQAREQARQNAETLKKDAIEKGLAEVEKMAREKQEAAVAEADKTRRQAKAESEEILRQAREKARQLQEKTREALVSEGEKMSSEIRAKARKAAAAELAEAKQIKARAEKEARQIRTELEKARAAAEASRPATPASPESATAAPAPTREAESKSGWDGQDPESSPDAPGTPGNRASERPGFSTEDKAELEARKAEIAQAARHEVKRLLTIDFIAVILLGYFVYILARAELHPVARLFTWLLLLADGAVLAGVIWTMWRHYHRGKQAVAKGREQRAEARDRRRAESATGRGGGSGTGTNARSQPTRDAPRRSAGRNASLHVAVARMQAKKKAATLADGLKETGGKAPPGPEPDSTSDSAVSKADGKKPEAKSQDDTGRGRQQAGTGGTGKSGRPSGTK